MKTLNEKPRIKAYLHCKTCTTGRLATGWTDEGMQVFCENCQKNVIDLDFEDKKVKLYVPPNPQ